MRVPLLSRLADRLILCPTRHPISTAGKRRHIVSAGVDQVEVWIQDVGPPGRDFDAFVLKFPGTGGRAECSTDQPASLWPQLRTQIWTVNPPGYGGSSGRASLSKAAVTARAVFDDLQRRAAGAPVILASNSLGGISALYLATVRPVAGLILRNPPYMRGLILGRFGRQSLYLGAWLIAGQVPTELDALENARRATAPALFVMSVRDKIVPARYQQMIQAEYAGPKRVVLLHEADHASAMGDAELAEYQRELAWLWSVADGAGSPPADVGARLSGLSPRA